MSGGDDFLTRDDSDHSPNRSANRPIIRPETCHFRIETRNLRIETYYLKREPVAALACPGEMIF